MFERVVKFRVCRIVHQQWAFYCISWKIVYNGITKLQNLPNTRVMRSWVFSCLFYKVKFKAEAVAQRCSAKQLFLNISQNFAWKHVCQTIFFNKVRRTTLQLYLKRDSRTGVFLWSFRNSEEHLIYGTTPVATSVKAQRRISGSIKRLLGKIVFAKIV